MKSKPQFVSIKKTYDLEQLFESKLEKNLQYYVSLKNQSIVDTQIDGTTLVFTAKKLGSEEVTVIAETENKRYQVKLSVKVAKFWDIYQERIIAVTIVFLIVFTLIVYLIVYLVQKHRRKKALKRHFTGSLIGYFTDVKSANDLPMMEWDLCYYPGVGITLNTLLKEVKVVDYFLGSERIWIYPYDESQITIVHNLCGSIFLGNKLIEKNIPVQISSGDIIYVCFEENGAEIELHYRNTGGNKNDQRLR